MPGLRRAERLNGVHPDLVAVVNAVAEKAPWPVMVVEGMRTLDRQKELKAKGASKTLNSRHLTGHAVDLAPHFDVDQDGDIDGTDLFSWAPHYVLADLMKAEAKRLGVSIVWGGDWKSFKDGPHYELDRKRYPAPSTATAPAPVQPMGQADYVAVPVPEEAAKEAPYEAPPPEASPIKTAIGGVGFGGIGYGAIDGFGGLTETVQIAIIVLIALAGIGAFIAYRKGWLK